MELGAGSLENHRSAKLTRGERAGKLAGAVECQKHVGERAEGRRGHGHGGGATLDWMMAFGLEGQSRLRTLVHLQTITVTMTNFCLLSQRYSDSVTQSNCLPSTVTLIQIPSRCKMKGMDLTYFLHLLLQELVLLDDLLVAALLLLLVLLALAGVVRVLPDEEDLGDEDEAHREEAAEEVGHRHEAESRVLLIACTLINIKSGLGGLEV